jgi:hypothetical protein
VCIAGVHGVIESLGHPRLRKIHDDAGLVTPDGMKPVWMSRWLGFDRTRRVYGPDLMRTLSALSVSRGYDSGLALALKISTGKPSVGYRRLKSDPGRKGRSVRHVRCIGRMARHWWLST